MSSKKRAPRPVRKSTQALDFDLIPAKNRATQHDDPEPDWQAMAEELGNQLDRLREWFESQSPQELDGDSIRLSAASWEALAEILDA